MRELIAKNFQWKLFSLGLAVVIWLTVRTVSTEKDPKAANLLSDWETRPFTNLPVLIVSAAADVREIKVNPDNVDVTVRGRPEVMAALRSDEIRAIVDLTEIESARGLRKRVSVSAPPGVTVIEVVPSEVNVVVPPKKDAESKP